MVVKVGVETCGYPSDVDVEGTKLELVVVASGLVLCDNLDTLDDRVVEDLIADDMIVSALDDRIVDRRIADLVSEVLALEEVSVVGVVAFWFDKVVERRVEDDWVV